MDKQQIALEMLKLMFGTSEEVMPEVIERSFDKAFELTNKFVNALELYEGTIRG